MKWQLSMELHFRQRCETRRIMLNFCKAIISSSIRYQLWGFSFTKCNAYSTWEARVRETHDAEARYWDTVHIKIIPEFPLKIKETAMTQEIKCLVKPTDGAPGILTTVFRKKFRPEFDWDWPSKFNRTSEVSQCVFCFFLFFSFQVFFYFLFWN